MPTKTLCGLHRNDADLRLVDPIEHHNTFVDDEHGTRHAVNNSESLAPLLHSGPTRTKSSRLLMNAGWACCPQVSLPAKCGLALRIG